MPPAPDVRTVLVAALFGLFTVGFTITILAVSLPQMADDLDSSVAVLTWTVTGPLLGFAVVGPASGKLGDLYGHRRVYLLGLSGAAIFALATAAAPTAPLLVAFRVLSATFGAATGPASMAMINRMLPPERRTQAMGYWSLVMAGGPVLGVVAGGPVIEAYGWRWIFLAQFLFSLPALAVCWRVLPSTPRAKHVRFDWQGSLLIAVGAGALILGLNQGPLRGWTNPLVLACFVLSPLILWAFVAWERRTPDPLMPLRYFGKRNVAFPLATQMLTNGAYMGGFILTPLLLEDVLGYGPTRTGLISIFRPLAFAITGPLIGSIAMRAGERNVARTGALLVGASMVVLSMVGEGTTDLFIAGGLALSGMGMGATQPSMVATIANAVDEQDLGVAGAAQQMLTQIGTVSGIQVLQTVQMVTEERSGLTGSYGNAYLFGAVLAVAGAVTASFIASSNRPAPARRLRRSEHAAARPACRAA